jgi:murein DD-endopeptidase MepM/ murein hydrolase activator NlpD
VVSLDDIPDFDKTAGVPLPGQRPKVGDAPTVTPVAVVLVSCPLDREYRNVALNAAAVDAYIAAEVVAERAHSTTVERWSPWSTLQVQLGIAAASRYNYARMTVDGRSWYGFLDAEYLNLTATAYNVTPDHWTTYGPSIGYSNVVRGHVAVAASAAGDIGYCLEPEPFAPGDLIGYGSYTADPLGAPRVLVISTTDLRAEPFVQVDDDVSDTMGNPISQTLATGTIEAPQPVGDPQGFPYSIGSSGYDDLFYYPYGGEGEVPSEAYFWPFAPSTWNVNNGHPGDEFRTVERPSHTGKDMGYGIANIEGTPIKSIGPGVVIAAGSTVSWGWRVIVQHPNGHWSGYAHMYAPPSVVEGQEVAAGTVLGGIGSTGDSTGNHLHFAIWSYAVDDYINPNDFMAEFNPDDLVVGDEGPTSAPPMYRPYATGATPSLVDGVIAEGGAFLYPSIGTAISHLSRLAHAPWISDGIQRVLLLPGGEGGGYSPVDLSPRDAVPTFEGAPTYVGEITTEIGYDTTLLADWTTPLPSDYDVWTKLRTGPFSAVQIADRLGSASEFDPQEVVGLGSLRVRFEGVFYPEADVAAWIVGAGGSTDDATPTRVPVGADMARYAVGRDSVLAGQAAGLSAERSQSVYDMILAMQRAVTDTSYTRASAFTASQYAIAEAI